MAAQSNGNPSDWDKSNVQLIAELQALRAENARLKAVLAVPSQPTMAASLAAVAPASVLVIEDDPQIQHLVLEVLKEQYQVQGAWNGQEGVQRAIATPPDLILCDLHLPDMNAHAILHQLQAYAPLRNTPVILISASRNEAVKANLQRLGVQDHLEKPFSLEALQALVQKWVGVKQAQAVRSPAPEPDSAAPDNRVAWNGFQEAEEPFRRAVLESPLPKMLHTEDGKVLQVNKAWTQLTGYTLEDVPTIAAWTEKASGGGKTDIRLLFQRLSQLTQAQAAGEHPITTKRQEVRIWDFHFSPLGKLASGQHLLLSTAIDVTERKRTEVALRRSEEQLHLALDVAHLGIWHWNVLTQTIAWSGNYRRLFGLTEEESVDTYDALLARIHSQDRQGFTQTITEVVALGTSYEHEFRILRSNGSLVWIASKGQVVYGQLDSVVSLIGVFMDVTVRKQAELLLQQANEDLEIRVAERTAALSAANTQLQRELHQRRQLERALQSSEVRLNDILNSAIAAIACFRLFANREWENSYFSAGTETMLGYTPEELMADRDLWFSRIHPEDLEQFLEQQFDQLLVEDHLNLEFRARHKDGSLRWMACTLASRRDQSSDSWIVTAVHFDITSLKQAEAALRHSEATQRALLQAIPDLIIRMHRDGTYLDFFPGEHVKLFQPKSLSMGNSIYNVLPAEQATLRMQYIQSALQTHELQVYEYELMVHGDLQYEEARIVPINDDEVMIMVRNITERKRAEAALQETLQLLNLHIANSPLATIVWDGQFRVQRWSQQAEQIFGWTEAEVLGKSLDEWLFIYEADLEKVHQVMLHGLGDRPTKTIINNRNYTRDKGVVECEWYNSLLYDEAGNIVSILSQVQDVTERKQAELGLRHQKDLREAIFNESADAIFLVDPETLLICDCNYRAAELFEVSSKEALIGLQSHCLQRYSATLEELSTIAQAINAKGHWSRELEYVTPTGKYFWGNLAVKRIHVAGQAMNLMRVTDISELKRSEDHLREAVRRWRYLLENVRLAVVQLDSQGNIEFINPFLLNLTGYRREDVLGKNWFDIFLPPELKPQMVANFREILEREAHPHYEHSILTQGGEERVIAWNNTQLCNLRGEVIGTVSIGEDITQRQAVERMKDDFISIVSHELRTPLTSIRGSLGLIATGVLDSDPVEMQRMIEIAATDTERLVRLVNDILDLERLNSGRAPLQKEWCEVGDLMQQSIQALQVLAQEAAVTLVLSPVAVRLWAAPDRIIQTFTNLLSNAIKFSPPGSTVNLTAQLQDDQILFQVQDRGRGIPAEKLESIFGRFQQVDVSDSREKGGTGLGLAICQTIVQQHGGKIWAESVVGQGSVFSFTIPIPPYSGY